MPELPEVETVRRGLAQALPGRQVEGVTAGGVARLRRPQDPEALAARLRGGVMGLPRRRGKYLLLDVQGRGALMVHLGMTGRLEWLPGPAGAATAADKHEHLRLTFTRGEGALRLIDPRRFGMVVWVPLGQEGADPSLRRLGVEPLEGDEAALAAALAHALRAERRAVKVALMDQARVVGLGNIYACEALWRAGVAPSRQGLALGAGEVAAVAHHARAVLAEAIEGRGTTLRDYRAVDGAQGGFAVALAVYGREGERCGRCGEVVARAPQAGRSTFWCPGCQR